MTHEVHLIEKDAFTDANKSTNNHSTDQDGINVIESLIESPIAIDELQAHNSNDETIHQYEQKLSTTSTNQSDQENSMEVLSKTNHRCTGIFLAILASANFTTGAFGMKKLPVNLFDAILSRFILQSIIPLTVICYRKHRLIYGSKCLITLQILRAILTTMSSVTFFLSYHYLPLPDLTVCRYTKIAWTAILAMIIFRERISLPTTIAIILTLTGVVLVVQPTFLFDVWTSLISNRTTSITTKERSRDFVVSTRLLGVSMAIVCSITESLGVILNKKLLVFKVPQSVILVQYSSLTAFVLFLIHLYNRFILEKYTVKPMFTWAFLAATFLALFLVNSAVLSQRALKFEHPSIVSIAGSSDILFSIVLQSIFTDEKWNWFVIIGALLVMSGIFLIGIHKFWQDKKKSFEKK